MWFVVWAPPIKNPGYAYGGAPGTLGFSQYFPSKYRWKPKKALSERGASGTAPYVKSAPGYCITFIKSLEEALQLLG